MKKIKMKKNIIISDIVIRAYSWNKTTFGVVVGYEREEYGADGDTEEFPMTEEPFILDHFTVMWDDGSLSTEMWEELIHYDEYVEAIGASR